MSRGFIDRPTREYREFVDWLRGELKRQKKTQIELAAFMGKDPVSITQRMNGTVQWSYLDVLEALDFLGCDFEDVYGRKERKDVS